MAPNTMGDPLEPRLRLPGETEEELDPGTQAVGGGVISPVGPREEFHLPLPQEEPPPAIEDEGFGFGISIT